MKGTGITGLFEQLDRDWAQSSQACLSLKGFRCQEVSKNVAWVPCEFLPEVKIEETWQKFPELRWTLVMKKEGDSWKIVHTHASWSHLEQKEGESFPSVA